MANGSAIGDPPDCSRIHVVSMFCSMQTFAHRDGQRINGRSGYTEPRQYLSQSLLKSFLMEGS